MIKRLLAAVAGALCVLVCSAAASAAELGTLQAKGAILTTDTGQVLFEQNADTVCPPASVTKLMTMLLVMEAVDDGKAELTDMVTASAHAAEMGGSQIYLKEGEQMSLEDMLKSIAVASANDAAVAVAEYLGGSETQFVAQMNERAKELGCTGTEFVNPNGLDTDGEETKTTARDLALISAELLRHPTILDYTSIWMDTVRDGSFGLTNTNKLLRSFDGMVGLKTGYTAKAGYCISAVAERDGMRLIAVVLGEPDKEARNEDITVMLQYGFALYSMVPVLEDGQELTDVSVELGTKSTVSVQLEDDTPLLLEKETADGVQRELQLAQRVRAPVKKGDQLGEIILTDGETEIERRAIVAAETVERMSVSDIYRALLDYLLMKNLSIPSLF